MDETIDYTKGTGISAGPAGVIRGATAQVGDVVEDLEWGTLNAPFEESATAQTQLMTLANITKRFIRESTTGRPFAVEIADIAEEMASPSWMETDEGAFIKLKNMRNQLLEVQGIATSMLQSPQGFDKARLIGAREDLLILGPLLDNYDIVIRSYERGLEQTDKPDPSMFERGLGNAQGSAAGYVGASPEMMRENPLLANAQGSANLQGMARIPFRPHAPIGENIKLFGYDTGVDRSAILANQGGPIPRRGN
jgi:hypothetical protein